MSLNLIEHGAARVSGAITSCLPALHAALATVDAERAGTRLVNAGVLRVLADGPVAALARRALGPGARAVRAVLFNKTARINWSLGWHQDRTIAVHRRIEVAGFGPWTLKHGLVHVEPPIALLNRMLTIRLHLDPVGADNAPLLIAPGSHRLGRVPVDMIAAVVARCGTLACLAEAGDAWIYATPILHASDAARLPAARRVLQLDYSADDLPGGLTWLEE